MCSSKFKPLNGGVDKSIVVKADFILAGCASMCRNSVLYPKLFENVWMSLDLHKGRIYDNFDKVNGDNGGNLGRGQPTMHNGHNN